MQKVGINKYFSSLKQVLNLRFKFHFGSLENTGILKKKSIKKNENVLNDAEKLKLKKSIKVVRLSKEKK